MPEDPGSGGLYDTGEKLQPQWSRSGAYGDTLEMDPERWRDVETLYHATLARPAGERAAFLAQACAGDDNLRREVQSRLDQPDSGRGALESGGLAMAAKAVAPGAPKGLAHRPASGAV